MIKRKWYDFFGIIQRAEEAEERNRVMQQELEQMSIVVQGLKEQTKQQSSQELEKAKLEIAALTQRLEKVSRLRECQISKVEGPKKAGRPRIDHKDKLLAVDLDTYLALEIICTATGTKWTRLVNDILRDWISKNNPSVYSEI